MGLNIIICIKSVVVKAPSGRVVRSSEACELNPYDRPALEAALRLKEENGGTLTALSMGPESCAFVLHEAMGMGVDRGVLVCDPALAGSDTLATTTALAAALNKLAPFDLVLFGTRSADSDTGQVGPQTAVLLDLPLVTWACAIERRDAGLVVERRADGFIETFELSFPGALTIHPAWVQPRDVGLAGLQTAFEEQEITKWNLAEIGLSPEQVGESGSPTSLLSLARADRARKCDFMEGTPEEQADDLVRRLLESGLIS